MRLTASLIQLLMALVLVSCTEMGISATSNAPGVFFHGSCRGEFTKGSQQLVRFKYEPNFLGAFGASQMDIFRTYDTRTVFVVEKSADCGWAATFDEQIQELRVSDLRFADDDSGNYGDEIYSALEAAQLQCEGRGDEGRQMGSISEEMSSTAYLEPVSQCGGNVLMMMVEIDVVLQSRVVRVFGLNETVFAWEAGT